MEATVTMLHGNNPLPQLTNLDTYHGSTWNLAAPGEDQKRAYWVQLFRDHFPTLIDQSKREAAAASRNLDEHNQKCSLATIKFTEYLDSIETLVQSLDHFGVLDICYARERILIDTEIPDPYRLAKHEQTLTALQLLPDLLKEHDQLDEDTLTLGNHQRRFRRQYLRHGCHQNLVNVCRRLLRLFPRHKS